jgi:CRP-like cAMP-binding protein
MGRKGYGIVEGGKGRVLAKTSTLLYIDFIYVVSSGLFKVDHLRTTQKEFVVYGRTLHVKKAFYIGLSCCIF